MSDYGVIGSTAVNDYLLGSSAAEQYSFSYGDGRDILHDYDPEAGQSARDRLTFGEGIGPGDIELSSVGYDLIVTLLKDGAETGDTLTLQNALNNPAYHVEEFAFANGTTLTTAELLQRPLNVHNDAETNVLIGVQGSSNTFFGGKGNDTLYGSTEADIYHFNRGDGQDTVRDMGGVGSTAVVDRLVFGEGISADDLRLTESGSHLILSVLQDGQDSGDQITLEYAAVNAAFNVETLTFADGSSPLSVNPEGELSDITADAETDTDADESDITADTPSPDAPIEPPVSAEPERKLVDGVEVQTQVEVNDDGIRTETITIAAVDTSGETDGEGNNRGVADIPLLQQSQEGQADLSVALPAGVGLEAKGAAEPITLDSALNGSDGLLQLIEQTVPTGQDSRQADMRSGSTEFLQAMAAANEQALWVNKITLNVADSATAAAPIQINGQAAVSDGGSTEGGKKVALVIDASNLPSGTELQLNDVSFAVIVGPATLTGGEGQNTVFAGEGGQTIVLGADDDELHGGDGNDTVGSKGGDDLIFGEAGNDTLFGGAGNDTLHGGADIDIATYDGNLADYDLVQTHGIITVTRKDDQSDSDTLINIEQVQFADGNHLVTYDTEQKALATLYQNVLGRQADLDGFQWWSEQLDNGASFGDTVLGFMQSDEYQGASIDGLNNADQLDTLYQAVLGRTADEQGKAYWLNAMDTGMDIVDVADSFTDSPELLGQLQLSHQWEFTL